MNQLNHEFQAAATGNLIHKLIKLLLATRTHASAETSASGACRQPAARHALIA
jgi:hypothetical protein